MLFPSEEFLFIFMPALLLSLVVFRKNITLLIFSLIFYYFGEGYGVIILILSIFVNYITGLLVEKGRNRQIYLLLGVILNLLILFYYKYIGFLLNDTLHLNIEFASNIILPLGISFFTFQGISYIVDVYRGDAIASKQPLKIALYISLFPQLIAGPIVRYSSIEKELYNRTITTKNVYRGISDFIVGLGSKVIVADNFAKLADIVYAAPINDLTRVDVFIGVLAYSIQILFDFAGYSLMAIGIGYILGFKFPQNFNYPYISRSITEFWRRWHMSLSSWFKDYLYIPLGGNKVSTRRTYINLLIVFTLTGLWHGANWSFLFWGWWHGLALILERLFLRNIFKKLPSIIPWIYCMTWVFIGWLLFRAVSLEQALSMINTLLMGNSSGVGILGFKDYINIKYALLMIITVICSIPQTRAYLEKRVGIALTSDNSLNKYSVASIAFIFHATILLISIVIITSGTYSPFLYFRF